VTRTHPLLMTLLRNPKHIVIRKKGDVHEVAERKTPYKKQFVVRELHHILAYLQTRSSRLCVLLSEIHKRQLRVWELRDSYLWALLCTDVIAKP
jgi:hypothetical protein